MKRKTDVLLKRTSAHDQYYALHMTIPLSSYDGVTPVTLVNLSTVLRLVRHSYHRNNHLTSLFVFSFKGTIPLLTSPVNLDRTYIKCSDDHDRVITNRFNPEYRLTVRDFF